MLNITRKEYTRMRRAGVGAIVGQQAATCLRLAKARTNYRMRDDMEILHLEEQESYESVYGQPAPEGAHFICIQVRIDGEVRASLGFVEDSDPEYVRQVENELIAEAIGW